MGDRALCFWSSEGACQLGEEDGWMHNWAYSQLFCYSKCELSKIAVFGLQLDLHCCGRASALLLLSAHFEKQED